MFNSAIKAEILHDEGKTLEAISYLESFVLKKRKITDEVIQAYEYLVRYKTELSLEWSEEFEFLSGCDFEDVFADTLFSLCLAYEKKKDFENCKKLFLLFCERVNDPEDFSKELGFFDDWTRIKSIYDKTENQEFSEAMSESQLSLILCEEFVERVNADGLDSYFSSEFSKYCKETQKLLEKIGSKIYSSVLEKAIGLFPENFDFSDENKTEAYLEKSEKIQEQFEKIEDEIYSSEEDIEMLLKKLKETAI
ncbi:MAG: DUF4375 domain-containing protein [Clostridia bacterium]|nr:DUF4375 domain-containing protein [Clostridia bacterium]MBQ8029873.1 DUF4375 domain-containing protein [Clostridia bacterium]